MHDDFCLKFHTKNYQRKIHLGSRAQLKVVSAGILEHSMGLGTE
jgi:hypothetical protein